MSDFIDRETNFDVKQYQDRSIRQYGERILLFNIFRLVWPNIQRDFHILVPGAGSPPESLSKREVKYKRSIVKFEAEMERIDNIDFVFIVPQGTGELFEINRINKRRKHGHDANQE